MKPVDVVVPRVARFRAVGSVLETVPTPGSIKRERYSEGSLFPIVDQGQSFIAGHTDEAAVVLPAASYIVFGDHTRALKFVDFAFAAGADGTKVLRPSNDLVPKYAYYALQSLRIPDRGYNRHWAVLREMLIPVPAKPVQERIVAKLDRLNELHSELEGRLEAELKARRAQFKEYRRLILTRHETAPMVPLGELAVNLDRKRKPVTRAARSPGGYPYYGASGVVDYVADYIFDGDYLLVSEDGANLLARATPIAFSISGRSWVNNHAHVLEFDTPVRRKFTEIYLNSLDLAPFVSGASQPKLSKASLERIPVPDLASPEVDRLVDDVNSLEATVDKLWSELGAEVAARRQQYEHYRDRLLTFEELGT